MVFVCHFTNTLPVLDQQIQVAGWVQEFGWDMGMLFQYLASVLIHLPTQHWVSQELTQQTPPIAALPSEGKPWVVLLEKCFTSISSPGQLCV